MPKTQLVTVKQDEAKPVPKEVLAKAIVDISASLRHLRMSGLNRKAVVALVGHSTKLGLGTIDAVLNALETLKRDYCN
jgi:hypothetical protein